MAEIPDDVKQQAALAAMDAKNSLNVDALPVADASMADVERGATTIPGQGFRPGANYNPAEPVPERESPDSLER
jgi:hypothetical protein